VLLLYAGQDIFLPPPHDDKITTKRVSPSKNEIFVFIAFVFVVRESLT
jgi:hypothetical protein